VVTGDVLAGQEVEAEVPEFELVEVVVELAVLAADELDEESAALEVALLAGALVELPEVDGELLESRESVR
jgi:hypothetical protein